MSDRADTMTTMTVPTQPDHPDDERQPPADLVAEQCVLGAMLLSGDAIDDVMGLLTIDDFYRPAHQDIFRAILELYARGEPVDPVTFLAAITKTGLAAKLGGGAYVHTLVASVPTTSNAAYYAQIVRERAVMRRLIAAGTRYVQMGYGTVATAGGVDDVLATAQTVLDDVAAATPSADDIVTLDVALQQTMDEIDAITAGDVTAIGVPTGLIDLDELLNGLHAQQLIVVGGRPGLGKSTLGMDFLRSACVRHGKPGVLFSLEMGRVEIVSRLLAAEGRIELSRLRNGKMSDVDWDRLGKTLGRIAEAPMLIDDSPNLSMGEIRAKARRLKQKHDIQIIVVDYLQLMSSGSRAESRQQEVASMSRALKLLAKELCVPVVAISQLNRGPDQRHDKRPQLSDLRESGAVEQDADVVILLHREDYYDKDTDRIGEADLIVAKHRNGATRDVAVAAQLHYSRFTDLEATAIR